MPTYRNGIETRENLYHSARRIFAAKGYHNASVKDIVQDAHAKLGLFSYYFESKEALALEIFLEIKKDLDHLLLTSPVMEQLKSDTMTLDMTTVRMWFTVIAQHPHLARFAHELCVTDAYLAHTRQERQRIWHNLYPGRKESDPDKIDYSLASGMMSQFVHDVPYLELQDDLQNSIDHVLGAMYSLLRFRRSAVLPITESLRLSREAVEQLHIHIGPEFEVSEASDPQ